MGRLVKALVWASAALVAANLVYSVSEAREAAGLKRGAAASKRAAVPTARIAFQSQDLDPAVPSASQSQDLDPAAWGGDHVGKALPDYVTGDECLFCHRDVIAPLWVDDLHARTIRFAEPGTPPLNELEKVPALKAIADEALYVLGRSEMIRFLKAGRRYGRLDLATAALEPGAEGEPARLLHAEDASWDEETFAESCAGCHATAVETKLIAYGAISLDCFSCHGVVPLAHTGDTGLAALAREWKGEAKEIASICAQCHLRGGKSRSTGRPYPNQFVAGDNLLRDFEVDFSDEALAKMNPGDRHIFENVRDVVIKGETRTTCLTCHEVHRNSSELHAGLRKGDSCLTCHNATGPMDEVIAYEVHSEVCRY